MVKTPKLYVLDTGLLSFLLRYPDPETLLVGPAAGVLLENFIVTELFKTVLYRGIFAGMYCYRDTNENEIDIVIEQDYRQVIGEVKLSKCLLPRH